MRVKLLEIAVYQNDDELTVDIGEQARLQGQYLWWLIVAQLRIAYEIEQTWRRAGELMGIDPNGPPVQAVDH